MKCKLFTLLLICNYTLAFALQIDTLKVESVSMMKSIPNIVILPESYSAHENAFPVLYLLHGATGSYTSWINNFPNLKEYANTYGMIIVCPDGGYTSWYLDSPVDPTYKYETYISKELVPTIDKKYNTIKNKSARAISGLSMGGHGAFYLAFKHQDIWGAAGSMSGGLDIRPFTNNWDLNKRLGEYAEHKENWEQHTLINMLHLLKKNNLKLIFDCGVNDFFYDGNKRMHAKLVERNISHDYIERAGGHELTYWQNSLKYQFLFFSEFFKSE